jgi:hypothetical protein
MQACKSAAVLGVAINIMLGAGSAAADSQEPERGWFVGLGAATTTPVLRPDFGGSADGAAPRLLAGRSLGSHWAVELGYLDIGEESGFYRPVCAGDFCPAIANGLAVDSRALSLGVRYQWRLGDWRPFMKLGVHRTDSDIRIASISFVNGTSQLGNTGDAKQHGGYGELGVGYAFNQHWQLRLSGEWYDFEARDSGNAGLGLLFAF